LANDDERWENWNKTLQKANDEGIIIIYSNNVGDKFAWGGCPPYKDRNNVLNYEIAKVFIEEKINNKSEIIIPADYRTTANNQSNDGYTYYGVGGWSWAIPYFAGLCALGLEINPHLTYEQMQRARHPRRWLPPSRRAQRPPGPAHPSPPQRRHRDWRAG
jgi:hypothetical protein